MGKAHKGKKFSVRPTAEDTGDSKNSRRISQGLPEQGNQWQASKRQQDWLQYYMDPKEEETWGNAYQSALKAGYSETYARNIMNPSLALQWVQQAKNIVRLNPEHLKIALVKIISNNYSKDSDKIAAIKLLGIDQNMFVQKQIIGISNIEEALNELE